MKNILLAVDATNVDMTALNFACYVGQLTGSKVTGVFLENMVADEKLVVKNVQGTIYPTWEIDTNSPAVQEKIKLIEANMALFREVCEKKGIRCVIHRDEGVPVKEMIAESRYADLIIIDAATSFRRMFEGAPTDFVKDVLEKAECPVIIAPESFEGVEGIIFAYDGSASAAFAMKQFTYLFPQLDNKKVTVFHVANNNGWDKEEKQKLCGWLQNHYSAIGFETVSGDAAYELFSYLFHKKNVFIVMGAYGRNAFSRYFKHSHADMLMKTITHPLFIAHY